MMCSEPTAWYNSGTYYNNIVGNCVSVTLQPKCKQLHLLDTFTSVLFYISPTYSHYNAKVNSDAQVYASGLSQCLTRIHGCRYIRFYENRFQTKVSTIVWMLLIPHHPRTASTPDNYIDRHDVHIVCVQKIMSKILKDIEVWRPILEFS